MLGILVTSCKDTRVGSLLVPEDTNKDDFSSRSYLQEEGRQYIGTSATLYTLNGRLEYEAEDGVLSFPLRLTKPLDAGYTGSIVVDNEWKGEDGGAALLAPEFYKVERATVTVAAGEVRSEDLFQIKLLDLKGLKEKGDYLIPLQLVSEDKGAKVSVNTHNFAIVVHIEHDDVHGLWAVTNNDEGLTKIASDGLSLNPASNGVEGHYEDLVDGDPLTGISVYLEYSIQIDGIGGPLKAIALKALQEEWWGTKSLAGFPSEIAISYIDKLGKEHALGQASIDPPTSTKDPNQTRVIRLLEPVNDAEAVVIKMLQTKGWGYSVGFSEISLYK